MYNLLRDTNISFIFRYFSGSQVIVKAVKPIASGKEICENYGPIYTEVARETRRNELKLRYWFDCNCIPCTEDWPVFDNMTTDVLRFRCIKERSCPGVMFVKLTTDEFMFPCPACKEQICIFGGLKQLNVNINFFLQYLAAILRYILFSRILKSCLKRENDS